jgi:hypothetical protein
MAKPVALILSQTQWLSLHSSLVEYANENELKWICSRQKNFPQQSMLEYHGDEAHTAFPLKALCSDYVNDPGARTEGDWQVRSMLQLDRHMRVPKYVITTSIRCGEFARAKMAVLSRYYQDLLKGKPAVIPNGCEHLVGRLRVPAYYVDKRGKTVPDPVIHWQTYVDKRDNRQTFVIPPRPDREPPPPPAETTTSPAESSAYAWMSDPLFSTQMGKQVPERAEEEDEQTAPIPPRPHRDPPTPPVAPQSARSSAESSDHAWIDALWTTMDKEFPEESGETV